MPVALGWGGRIAVDLTEVHRAEGFRLSLGGSRPEKRRDWAALGNHAAQWHTGQLPLSCCRKGATGQPLLAFRIQRYFGMETRALPCPHAGYFLPPAEGAAYEQARPRWMAGR